MADPRSDLRCGQVPVEAEWLERGSRKRSRLARTLCCAAPARRHWNGGVAYGLNECSAVVRRTEWFSSILLRAVFNVLLNLKKRHGGRGPSPRPLRAASWSLSGFSRSFEARRTPLRPSPSDGCTECDTVLPRPIRRDFDAVTSRSDGRWQALPAAPGGADTASKSAKNALHLRKMWRWSSRAFSSPGLPGGPEDPMKKFRLPHNDTRIAATPVAPSRTVGGSRSWARPAPR